MAGQQVFLYAPIDSWLIGWVRTVLGRVEERDVWVSDHWPQERKPPPARWVAIRDDGGQDANQAVQVRLVSITCAAPTREETDRLAEKIAACLRGRVGMDGTPCCDVRAVNGPVPTSDRTYAHLRLITADLLVVGKVIEI